MPMQHIDSQREYQRNWLKQRRDDWFLEKFCVYCGSIDDLELDHIDPSKKVSHRIWSWSKAKMLRELDKCQPLCKDCHRAKTTYQVYNDFLPHGVKSMYKRHLCRCKECKAWHAGQMRKERLVRRQRQLNTVH